jgi:hypothetical protein
MKRQQYKKMPDRFEIDRGETVLAHAIERIVQKYMAEGYSRQSARKMVIWALNRQAVCEEITSTIDFFIDCEKEQENEKEKSM